MNIRALGHFMKGSRIIMEKLAEDMPRNPFRMWSIARVEGSLRIIYNYDNVHGTKGAYEYYDDQYTLKGDF